MYSKGGKRQKEGGRVKEAEGVGKEMNRLRGWEKKGVCGR